MTTNSDPVDRAPGAHNRLNDYLRQVIVAIRQEYRSDVELLARFVEQGDQEAFRALVGRYAQSVLAACLAVLGDSHDAEDAFQAAFLALARYARTVDARRGVGPWVRSAARNAARKVRRESRREATRVDRLRDHLATDSPPGAVEPRSVDESHTWVLAAEELERLPRRLREPLVMYYLEGRTLAQIAEQLGCSIAAAHRRVGQGMERLRVRLSARGVALTAGLLTAIPTGLGMNAAMATAFVQGLTLPSPRVAALTDAILAPRFPSWLIAVGATILLAAGTAVALVAYPTADPSQPPLPVAEPNAKQPGEVAADKSAKSVGRATADLSGRVTDAAGKPVPAASVSALVRRPWAPGDRGLRDDVVAKVTTDADGRYAIKVPTDFATHYPERSVTLLVSGPGLPTTTKLVRLGVGSADIGVPVTRTLNGVCVGPDGKPVPGVKLGVVRIGNAAAEAVQGREQKLPDGWPVDVVSEKDGSFFLAGLPASEDVWIEVRDERFALTTVRFAAGGAIPICIALAPPRIIEGRVTAEDTNKPLGGARVSLFAGPWQSHHHHYTAMTVAPNAATGSSPVEFDVATGADGVFCVRLPPEGPYRLLVHPPAGSSYLSVARSVKCQHDQTRLQMDVKLPPGEVVRGVLRDDQGKPIAGAWLTYDADANRSALPAGVIGGRDIPTLSNADGSFQLIAPAGAGAISVFGPDANFVPGTFDFFRCSGCGKDHLRRFEHARLGVVAAHGRAQEPVTVTLRRGVAVSGKVVGQEGEPVKAGVLVCRSVVQPLRNVVVRPVAFREGVFELPGCDAGREYPVILLDAERQLGAVAKVKVGGEAPVVKLEPCGVAEVRLVDQAGAPMSGVQATAILTLDCDRRAGAWGASAAPDSTPMDQSWFDPKHYVPGPVTDADGRVTLRALVPGVEYSVKFLSEEKSYATAEFRVSSGQVVRLPDVVARHPDQPALPVGPLPKND